MKFAKNLFYITTAIAAILVVSCSDEKVGPSMLDSSAFVAPALTNAATNTPVEFTPETAADLFETFKWEKANYGPQVATTYVLQIDNQVDFSSPVVLATTSGVSVDVTVEDFNDAMLALGLPTIESTVFVRVVSSVNGFVTDTDKDHDNTPLTSESVSRTVTPYRISDCGNFCSIAVIGSASPGGWNVDTDMVLVDPEDKYTWSVTLYLTAGEVKFRANDQWTATSNWGGTTFPEGTGTLDLQSNIPVATAGYYRVMFNDLTGDYSFTLLTTSDFTTVGIIGSGTPGGWDADTDLTKDAGNSHLWTGTVTLTDGEAKFRAENAWTNNWGGSTSRSGVAVPDGANIPVTAGTYAVRFNDATGEYSFNATGSSAAYPKLGIIGSATEGGWDADTDLIRNPSNPFLWSAMVELVDGEAKFRADDAWTSNWGGSAFPKGVGALNGPNIPAPGGVYFVTFNSGTGEYSFLK
jgi:hypothetical protein